VKGVGHTVAQQQRSTQGGQGPGPSHPDVWRVLGYLTTDVTSTDSPALLSPLQCTFTFPAPLHSCHPVPEFVSPYKP
jgi:hypothetical protein